MDSVKRKVLSDLFFAPSVVLPLVGGLSAALLSFAAGGSAYLTAAAAVGILGGVGWMLTRMIFKVEDITEGAMQAALDDKLREENAALDQLARQLQTDGDHRTQDYLTLLRSLRSEFEKAAHKPGVQFRSARVREQVSLVFGAAVEQLRQSYSMWELAESLAGDARKKILHNRERVLAEIAVTIERLQATVEQFEQLVRSNDKADLAAMRDELEETMKIAKRTEERMREIENPYAVQQESFDRQ